MTRDIFNKLKCMNEFEKFMSVKFQENKNDEN